MSSREPLTSQQIDEALAELPGWRYEDDALKKTFRCTDFREAISFIVRMAFSAEELNHHPVLHNVYNTVDVVLTTHDAGNKVTDMDIRLARAVEGFAWF